jgi:hypothetical protein
MVEAVLTGAITTHTHAYQPSDADLTAIAALAGTSGILKKTAADTWTLDTSAYLTAITKAMIEAQLTGAITTHTHAYQPSDADLTAIAALAGTSGILKKTAADTWVLDTSAYLTAITKAMIEAQLTGAITTHTHAYQPSDADLTAIAALAGTSGILKKTAADTWALDTSAYLTAITKAMIEAQLTGAITTHTHAYVAGTGTVGYLPIWLTGGATIGASLIFYEGPDVVQINTNNSLGNLRIGQKDASQVAAVDYTAYGNTLFGSKVSPLITSGYYNTVTGNNAGYSITVGFKNAIYAAFAASYLTTGDRNIIIGYLAGRNPDNDIAQYRIIGEDDMVLIGHGATKNNAGTIVNGIAIGSGAMVLLSNQAVLGNDSITSTLLKGTVTAPALKVTSAGYGAGKILQSDANGLLSYTSQPNAHNQVYVGSSQGAVARGDLTGATITYTPKGNNVLVLFSNTTSNQAAAVNIHYYIHVGTNVPGSADLYFGGGQQHCSFQALYQVTAGTPIAVKIQWSSSTDVYANSNYLTVIDLP